MVFGYIVVMEIISILENYSEIDPKSAGWINAIFKKLKVTNDKEDKGNDEKRD